MSFYLGNILSSEHVRKWLFPATTGRTVLHPGHNPLCFSPFLLILINPDILEKHHYSHLSDSSERNVTTPRAHRLKYQLCGQEGEVIHRYSLLFPLIMGSTLGIYRGNSLNLSELSITVIFPVSPLFVISAHPQHYPGPWALFPSLMCRFITPGRANSGINPQPSSLNPRLSAP